MTRRALVTGGTGFVGKWLIRALLERGWSVTGTTTLDGIETDGSDQVRWMREVTWATMDIREDAHVERTLERARPDAVFHLAGVASNGAARSNPGHAFDVNVAGTARLLADVARRRQSGEIDPVILVIGSSEAYGRHDAGEMPLDEGAALMPMTVYAATKAAQEVVSLQAARGDGLRVLCTRSFNHSGPGQTDDYFLPAIIHRAVTARRTGDTRLKVGNLTPVRDFLHVADVVEAYCALAETGAAGEVYNVCSGEGRSVREMTELAIRLLDVRVELEPDPSLQRAVDVPILVGDNTKVRAATGWRPRRTVDSIIEDIARAAA